MKTVEVEAAAGLEIKRVAASIATIHPLAASMRRTNVVLTLALL
jgi:hypothetical protein